MGRTSGTSIRSCTPTVSAARSPDSAARQHGQRSGRCSTTSSRVSLITRLWPSCPGLAPPGFERSRCSFRSVEGGLEEVREVFSGRCRRSTSSINSSLLRRSSSPRPIPPLNQQKRPTSRAWVIAAMQPANVDDRAGLLPLLPHLAALGFQGDLLGDSSFKGAPFAAAALGHDIHVSVSPGGTRDGQFLPRGIRWVVERLSLGSAATGGSTSCTTVSQTSLPRTSGLR